jgi:hypothetical protein
MDFDVSYSLENEEQFWDGMLPPLLFPDLGPIIGQANGICNDVDPC